MRDKLRLKLSKNQALVYEALSQASKPVGAYDLLDQLKAHGLRAPLQIYRALEGLIELKVVVTKMIKPMPITSVEISKNHWSKFMLLKVCPCFIFVSCE